MRRVALWTIAACVPAAAFGRLAQPAPRIVGASTAASYPRRESSAWNAWRRGARRGGRRSGRAATKAFVDPATLVEQLQHLPLVAYGAICVGGNLIPFFPGQALNLGAGVIYGFRRGWPLVCTSQALSATLAFASARGFRRTTHFEWMLAQAQRSPAAKKVIRVLSKITSDRKAAAGGAKNSLTAMWAAFLTTLLLRQAPIVPFSISNYVLGALSELPLLPFILGTLVGCSFGNALVVAAGAAGKEIGMDGMGGRTAILAAVGLAAIFVLGAMVLGRAEEIGGVTDQDRAAEPLLSLEDLAALDRQGAGAAAPADPKPKRARPSPPPKSPKR